MPLRHPTADHPLPPDTLPPAIEQMIRDMAAWDAMHPRDIEAWRHRLHRHPRDEHERLLKKAHQESRRRLEERQNQASPTAILTAWTQEHPGCKGLLIRSVPGAPCMVKAIPPEHITPGLGLLDGVPLDRVPRAQTVFPHPPAHRPSS